MVLKKKWKKDAKIVKFVYIYDAKIVKFNFW